MPSTFDRHDIRVFPCPNCGETINNTMQNCQFCDTLIDAAEAERAAAATSRVSAAVSDASYLRIMAWSLPGFFALAFVPFFSFVGAFGLLAVSYVLPFLCICWWFRYGNILTSDPDFPGARSTAVIITTIAGFNLLRDLGMRLLPLLAGSGRV